jgi:hypothetical protein
MTKHNDAKRLRAYLPLWLAASLIFTGCSLVQDPMSPLWEASRNAVYEAGVPELVELETVEDQYGSYIRTTIKDVSSIKNSELDGPVKEGPEEAKNFIIKFIVEEALDSIALDNQNAWKSWKKNVAPRYLHSDYMKEILRRELVLDDGFGGSMGGTGIILTDAQNTMPTLYRSGSSRSTGKLFSRFTLIEDFEDPRILYSTTQGSALYPVRDEDAKIYFQNYFRGEDGEFIDAGVESDRALNDGRDSYIRVDFNLSHTLKKENNSWKIIAFSSFFNVLNGTLLH